MKILTYNLWHGLSPSGLVRFESLEPQVRQLERQKRQLELLREVDADVIFLQEVNPVIRRAKALAEGLGMEQAHLIDNTGLRWLGFGFPSNLQSGLVTLFRSDFLLRDQDAVRLSGPPTGRYFSGQYAESRYALSCELVHPQLGEVLMLNTHLHHGAEINLELENLMSQWIEEGFLSKRTRSELRERIKEGQERRYREVKTLLEFVDEQENRYQAIVLGGDFNFTPTSDEAELLRSHGFQDLTEGLGATYDQETNWQHKEFLVNFRLPVVIESLGLNSRAKKELQKHLMEWDFRPRKIDYIWSRGREGRQLTTQAVRLGGLPDGGDFSPSDHFLVEVELSPWD